MKILKSLIPHKIRALFFKWYRLLLKKYWEGVEKQIPKVTLSRIHLEHAKLLSNREQLLSLLPTNAIVAEIGVAEGDFSEKILKITKPEKLHLVDFWGSERYGYAKNVVYHKFENELHEKKVEINLGYSYAVAGSFSDHYFDWIYIDTDHSYQTTKKELEAYKNKVKPGGIIAGHDYIMGNWISMNRYGVMEAVHEFCLNEHWQIIYLTTDILESPSFAIQKIK